MKLVALGSSFAAGPGIQPVVDKHAGRSSRNYANLLAERLGADLTDLTISGATTSTVIDRKQRRLWHRWEPQLAGLPADADLVTLTCGGNDLKYVHAMIASVLMNTPRERRFGRALALLAKRLMPSEATDADEERAASGLVRVVEEVRRRAPRARVVLVDYLTLVGPDTTPGPDLPVPAADVELFRRCAARLESAFVTAASRSGADLVRMSEASRDHAIGSADPWVVGWNEHGDGMRFHPNAAGMAAVAETIARHLQPAG